MSQIKVETLTPLWTADISGECFKIKETSIIGSLRWWYEALVRGLDGYACDPVSLSEKERCRLDYDRFGKALDSGKCIQETLDEQICPACQLFGCTGWSRRFRLEIEEPDKDCFDTWGLKKGSHFSVNINEIRSIEERHKWILRKTLEIIEKYGAIGGRTTRKPQKSKIGMPYGLIRLDCSEIERWGNTQEIGGIKNWLSLNKRKLGRENNAAWFDLRWYWKVDGMYLDRMKMNRLLRIEEGKPEKGTRDDEFLNFLRGKIGESKKIFSFGNEQFKIEPRVFGYVRNEDELKKIEKMIREELGDVGIVSGEAVLRELEGENE